MPRSRGSTLSSSSSALWGEPHKSWNAHFCATLTSITGSGSKPQASVAERPDRAPACNPHGRARCVPNASNITTAIPTVAPKLKRLLQRNCAPYGLPLRRVMSCCWTTRKNTRPRRVTVCTVVERPRSRSKAALRLSLLDLPPRGRAAQKRTSGLDRARQYTDRAAVAQKPNQCETRRSFRNCESTPIYICSSLGKRNRIRCPTWSTSLRRQSSAMQGSAPEALKFPKAGSRGDPRQKIISAGRGGDREILLVPSTACACDCPVLQMLPSDARRACRVFGQQARLLFLDF